MNGYNILTERRKASELRAAVRAWRREIVEMAVECEASSTVKATEVDAPSAIAAALRLSLALLDQHVGDLGDG